MHDTSEQTNVGENTDKLCFDKNDFMKPHFSVDEFLHKNRNVSSLELLRDNLGLYLKGLRASMIDLINEDYADFVSLSANLVGLDQSINAIQQPLGQFRDEVLGVNALLKQNIEELEAKLKEKQEIHTLKRNMQSLKKVYEIIDKLNFLLKHKLNNEQEIKAVDLERAVLHLVQLKFNVKYCESYLNDEQKQVLQELEQQIHVQLRRFFNEALKSASSTCTEQLECCLRNYITLDSCAVAESVFREDIVAPYMAGIITEQQLQNSPQGLAGIYSKILNFISLHMTDLLRLTQYTDKLQGFNFVMNSFWADVEMRLELYMNSIFAPGNSEVFYNKYKCTRDFQTKIEELLANDVAIKSFRQHKQTKSFQARWNLPVYFQICFQEIAGKFESKLVPLLDNDSLKSAKSGDSYQLSAFNAASNAVQNCWADGIYLPEVFPKFYKLCIQILQRLCRWCKDVLNLVSGTNYKLSINKIEVIVAMHADIRKLSDSLPQLQQHILASVPSERSGTLLCDTIGCSFADLNDAFKSKLTETKTALINMLISESSVENVRQVNDLPRLYRKTNRDVPTKCSAYVEQILRPLKSFAALYESQLGAPAVTEILANVFTSITKDYHAAVTDVLTSVQKTEESLRRLRNLKSGATGQTVATSTTSMSDDDKIRLQLRVDVETWTSELMKLHFTPTQIEKLQDLHNIVADSIKTKD